MARRSQCSSAGDNPLDPNYLHPHYREEYRLAIDALVESDLDGYCEFLQSVDVVDFLSKPEIEYIQNTVQNPRHTDKPGDDGQGDDTSAEGSSDTYWPMLSDMEAPSLDLGWPQLLHFIGPTEITTFVNPPDPAMPSIKTQARRLIKDAQLVIAIAMDIFTDVDIFADLLEATTRNVAVYIVLDQQNAHLFAAMVANCRVNLEQVKSMRVRTVAGTTYRCRTGKSFQGQMMERFLLIDSRAVLGGNYSFMWSYEKLHRCLAHLFLGQLVVTFDEEFRILYAQSEPIVIEGAVVPIQKYSSMPELQKQYPAFPRVKPEWPGNLYEGLVDVDARGFPLRRGESDQVLYPTQPNIFPLQQHRPGALDRNLFKGPNYREGAPGGIYQQYLMHRERQNMDALETQSTYSHRDQYTCERTGREPVYDLFGKFRLQRYQHSDQYSEPGGPPAMDQVDNFDHMLKFLQSNPSVDMGTGLGAGLGPGLGQDNMMVPEGPYMSQRRRQRSGQSYACQTSPTPLSPHEQKRFHMEPSGGERKPRDVDAKKGMRDWRILSYLSAYDESASEDTPRPQGSEVGDDSPFSSQERLSDPDQLCPRMGLREPTMMLSTGLPFRQRKHFQTDDMKNLPSMQTDTRTMSPATSESSNATEGRRVEDGTDKPAAETNEDLLRKRPNLYRASRLRNSLLFSSNLEQHRSLFDLAKPSEPKQEENSEGQERSESSEKKLLKQQSTTAIGEEQKPPELPFSQLQRTASFLVDMDDADSRLQFFRQLAAQRKAEAAAKSAEETAEKSRREPGKTGSRAADGDHKVAGQQQTSEVSRKPTDRPGEADSQPFKATKDKMPIITLHVSDSKSVETLSIAEDDTSEGATADQAHAVLPQIATDAEKIERKRLQEPAAAKEASLGSDAKDKSLDSAPKHAKEESSKKTTAETKDTSNITSSEKPADVVISGAVESSGTKEDLVEKRPKPTLQHASRLRNSLLFRSRSEQQRPQSENVSTGENITDNPNQEGGLSFAAADLGSLIKEFRKSEDCIAPANPTAESVHTQDSARGTSGKASEAKLEDVSYKRQASFTMGDKHTPLEFQSKVLQRTTAMLDLSDPHSRLQLFRELAAQRKAEQAAVKSDESAQKRDEPKDTSATGENLSGLQQSSTEPLPKPLPAGGAKTEAEAAHVLDDDAKTLKAQGVPEICEAKGLSSNSRKSSSSTDVEKMELKKLRDEVPTKPQCTSLTSSTPTDTSSGTKNIPGDVAMAHQDQTSEKQISKSEKCALPTEHVPEACNLPGLSVSAGQPTHSPATSHPVISTAQETEEKSVVNPSTKLVDSDSASYASTDVSSGTESFTTAPNSPSTPTPSELSPLSLLQKESKLTVETIPPLSPQPAPIKCGSPQRTSSTEIKSDQSTAKQASPSETCTPLESAEADSSSVVGPLSPTAHRSPPSPLPAKSPTVTSHPTSPLKVSCESGTGKTEGKSPATQTAITSPGVSAADSAVKTESQLAPSSSPARPTSIAVVSPAQHKSHSAKSSVHSATTPTSPVDSTNATTNTDSSPFSVSSPIKTTPVAVVSPIEPKSPSGIKVSASASVNTDDGLKCKDTTAKSLVTGTPAKTDTDSRLASVSSPVKAAPTAASPKVPRSPSNVKTKKKGSVPVSPEKRLSHKDTTASPAALTVDTVNTTNATLSPVSSPAKTNPPANATTAESSSSSVTKLSATSTVSNLDLSKGTSSPQKQDSPVVEVSKEHSSPSMIPGTSGAGHTPSLTQSEGCSSPKVVPTSPCGVKTVDSSSLQSPNKNNSSLSTTATATSVPSTIPVATTSHLPASPGPDTPTPAMDQEHAPQAPLSPALTISGDNSNSKLTSAEPVSSTDDSGSSANTTTSVDNSVTEGQSDNDAKEVHREHASADTAKPSEESPKDELSNATSQNPKDTVTSPSSEESEEEKCPAEEPVKSPPSRYQSSTANVLSCSNLRDDTKVLLEQISANSQNRAAKQNLPATDDAKGEEEKEPNEKSKRPLGSRFQPWDSHMTKNERDRLITAMESKRKERRVYSRFEAL